MYVVLLVMTFGMPACGDDDVVDVTVADEDG